MSIAIKARELCKNFAAQESFPGFFGSLKGLFLPQIKSIAAIHHLSFEIKEGERIAFIGPNGAGKSTTIKMLTGILHPTSGDIQVLGMVPWKERRHLGYHIGTVFGQRTQLWYHLPPQDTFDLLSKIYEINQKTYKQRLKTLVSLFEIEHLLKRTVRQLSLGERMRCEIVASLLHQPQILFLDEPTIGLDINAKLMIRGLLNKLSADHGITLFLTSHDTADIEQVCDRVLVLDKGTLVTDSSVKNLKKAYMKTKVVTLLTNKEVLPLKMPGVAVLENDHYHFICKIDLAIASIEAVIQKALELATIQDITIEDPSMEEVIRLVYRKQV